MSHAPFTEADVRYLLLARKRIYRTIEDNREAAGRNPSITQIHVRYDIRRVDSVHKDLRLQFFARLERPITRAAVKPLPGLSLLWYSKRIRGINWALRHDVIKNGEVISRVKGWLEHQWTDADQDKFIIGVDNEIHQTGMAAMIQFCLKRWNIEAPEQLELGGQ